MFAVIKTGGKQYLVTEQQKLNVEKLAYKEGEKFTFDEILLVGSDNSAKIGAPHVSGAKVEAEVLKHAKAEKIRMMRYHSKVRRRRVQGHRQPYTAIKILSIKG